MLQQLRLIFRRRIHCRDKLDEFFRNAEGFFSAARKLGRGAAFIILQCRKRIL